jgi:hypothetical protein
MVRRLWPHGKPKFKRRRLSLSTAYSVSPTNAKTQRRGKASFAAPCSASFFSNSPILCSFRYFSSCVHVPHSDWDGYLVCASRAHF